jgi:hypothetical protein
MKKSASASPYCLSSSSLSGVCVPRIEVFLGSRKARHPPGYEVVHFRCEAA